jgi:hypothetical protein
MANYVTAAAAHVGLGSINSANKHSSGRSWWQQLMLVVLVILEWFAYKQLIGHLQVNGSLFHFSEMLRCDIVMRQT